MSKIDLDKITHSKLLKLIEELNETIQWLYKDIAELQKQKDTILNDVSQQREAKNEVFIETNILSTTWDWLITKVTGLEKELKTKTTQKNKLITDSRSIEQTIKQEILELENQVSTLEDKKIELEKIQNDINGKKSILLCKNEEISILNTEIKSKKIELNTTNEYIKSKTTEVEKRDSDSLEREKQNKLEERELASLRNELNWYCRKNNIPFFNKNGKN